jgi:LuxR family transcriptional regulator, maltose regulon positive regulatory protein
VLLLRAQLHTAQDDEHAALADLQRAVELAAPEGYVQRFVNAGPSMAALLRQLQRRTHIPYIETLLTAFPSSSSSSSPPSPLIEPLSGRELDVLRLMAEGLTYQEVADRLVVSVNTVRFHVKSLYGKLGVDKRIAAVERARTLGLMG